MNLSVPKSLAVLKDAINAREVATIGTICVPQYIPPMSFEWGRLKLFE